MASYLPSFRISKSEGDPLSGRENGFCAESAGWWDFGAGGGLTAFLNWEPKSVAFFVHRGKFKGKVNCPTQAQRRGLNGPPALLLIIGIGGEIAG